MTLPIGELLLQNGASLMKMWSISIDQRERPFYKHSHPRFEITVVNHGSGEYTTEHALYPMLPGDVFVFSSNEVHCITQTGNDGLTITNLHFEPYYLNRDFFESSRQSHLNFCFSHADEFSNRIPYEKATLLREHHNRIKEEFLNTKEEFESAIRSHLHLMLIELLRNHHYATPEAIGQMAWDVTALYDHIDRHLINDLSLKELSDVVGMSPNYLSTMFKKLHGITLWEFITAKRIEKAVRILRSKEAHGQTILDIALQCGFNNTVHFNKTFKKNLGVTPHELRDDPKLLSH